MHRRLRSVPGLTHWQQLLRRRIAYDRLAAGGEISIHARESKRCRGRVLRSAVLTALLLTGLCCAGRGALAEDDASEAAIMENEVALPKQINLVAPDKDVPGELSALFGAWSGDGWNGVIPTALLVEKANQNRSASVVFAWGDIERTRRKRGWIRLTASFDHGVLSFTIPEHGLVEYSLADDGRLFGRYTYVNGRRDHVLLKRIDPAEREDIIVASRGKLASEVLAFPLVTASAAKDSVQLKGVFYRSPIAGRRPLVVFSGDSVNSDTARDRPNLAPLRSRQMLALGYSVLVLQRKGTGGSGGAFMEPRDETVSQGDQLQSALDDLDSAVSFMKRRDDIEPSRIVLMGVGRGGLLSVAYAGQHDGEIAGVINRGGGWSVERSWWRQKLTWGDFTASQLANAGKRTKVPMLWIYGGKETFVEYARNNYRGFTYQGGRGKFVDLLAEQKSGPSETAATGAEEKEIDRYIRSLN